MKVKLKINIITQLLMFFTLAIMLNNIYLPELIYMVVMLALATITMKNYQFFQSLKRLKWFFLVMMIIFAFNTPGEHVVVPAMPISPTYEGLLAACTQALRIALMLAALSLILTANSRQHLISGFYFLFSPLRYVGLDVERFAARLWLTLHYVESQQVVNKQDFMSQLKKMPPAFSKDSTYEEIEIHFALPKFTPLDYAIIALLAALILGLVMRAYL